MLDIEKKAVGSLHKMKNCKKGSTKTASVCEAAYLDMAMVVNNALFCDEKELVNEICLDSELKEMFEKISLYWVEMMNYRSSEKFLWDDRNKYSVFTSKDLMGNDVFVRSLLPVGILSKKEMERIMSRVSVNNDFRFVSMYFKNDKELFFTGRMFSLHPTQMQTFSRVVFFFLNETNDAVKMMVDGKQLRADWWKTALV